MLFWLCVAAALLLMGVIGYYALGLLLVGAWALSYLILEKRYGNGKATVIGSMLALFLFAVGLTWMLTHDGDAVVFVAVISAGAIGLNAPWIYTDQP